jgi:hypothetical protein
VAASDSNVVAPPVGPVSPLTNVLQPVSNAVTTFANIVQSVPGQVAALPTSTTPVLDVIASFQQMLTTVAGAVAPLTQLGSDLYALLGIPRQTQPLIGGGGTGAAFATHGGSPLFGPRAWQWPYAAQPVSSDGPLFGTMAPAPSLGAGATTGLLQHLSLAGNAPATPSGSGPPATRSLLENVVKAVLVPASLTALAALALPGIAGLLVICAAGMRVGYRQAKAVFVLRASGIARFAGSGPLGVVRSGSLVSLHSRTPRAPHAVRQKASPSAVRYLERVA